MNSIFSPQNDDMINVNVIKDKITKTLTTKKKTLLSEVLNEFGIALNMSCGGKGICKKCTVKIDGKVRLACQTVLNNDVNVELFSENVYSNILNDPESFEKPISPMYTRWGVSVDIGTTTVCAALSGAGKRISITARKNPQVSMGADVISRIEKSLSEDGLRQLSESIRSAIREMIDELCREKAISPLEIDAAVITGNTTMLYLLTGRSTKSLAAAPFAADCFFGETVPAVSLGLNISKKGIAYLPRCVSAFIGADMITALLSCDIYDGTKKTALLADIGTNGELAICHEGVLYCAGTSAGPAFEGYELSHGCYAVKGAIDKVWHKNNKIYCSTIEGISAVGVCGSGIVDAVSVMLELGIIDETGYLDKETELINGIFVTPEDIRKVQLAKGAIRAGIETVIHGAGVKNSQIKNFYIAGSFGNYLNINSAVNIGLIPREFLQSAIMIGNSAHIGATKMLRDKSLIEKSEVLASRAKIIPLESSDVFLKNFVKFMMFESV
ncbi:MAG: ASKHA domain-containing protein [Eubacterium sp.]|jgi:uncharacterized 2Fe-2S/4Fe-4S cluster protein (DUF4445 family)|nr:ASKHA domain-containing protein [Eubacterium sp.]